MAAAVVGARLLRVRVRVRARTRARVRARVRVRVSVLDARAGTMAEYVHATHVGELRLADVVDEVTRDDVGTGAGGALVAPLPA